MGAERRRPYKAKRSGGETACFAIRGKALTPTLKFSAEEGEPRVRIPAKQPKEKPVSDMAYGGLFERYGARNED